MQWITILVCGGRKTTLLWSVWVLNNMCKVMCFRVSDLFIFFLGKGDRGVKTDLVWVWGQENIVFSLINLKGIYKNSSLHLIVWGKIRLFTFLTTDGRQRCVLYFPERRILSLCSGKWPEPRTDWLILKR